LNLESAIFLCFAGALGGGMNAVAGGGSFIAFPALLFTGVPAIPANATNTLSLWVGTTASGGAYPQKLNIPRRILIPLVTTSLAGGLSGAILLIHTPARTFLRVIPWLLLGATLLFAFGKHLTGRISAGISHDAGGGAVIGASLFELLVAVYGGYFGGGIGIMNLAMLSALGMTDIHAMNKLKVMLGGVINGVATVTFILTKAIFWPQAMVMIFGSVLGGYSTAHYAQKLPQSWIKAFVIVVGTAMTVYFFWRGYR
jgi:uncharacterized membrane protein YfcA